MVTKDNTRREQEDNNDNRDTDILVDNDPLEVVTRLKYFGSTISEDGRSENELRSRITIATSALAKLETFWKYIHLGLKLRTIVIATLLYGAESWTLTTAMERKIQAFDMKAYCKFLTLSMSPTRKWGIE
jgi:hypothetical protein